MGGMYDECFVLFPEGKFLGFDGPVVIKGYPVQADYTWGGPFGMNRMRIEIECVVDPVSPEDLRGYADGYRTPEKQKGLEGEQPKMIGSGEVKALK